MILAGRLAFIDYSVIIEINTEPEDVPSDVVKSFNGTTINQVKVMYENDETYNYSHYCSTPRIYNTLNMASQHIQEVNSGRANDVKTFDALTKIFGHDLEILQGLPTDMALKATPTKK